MASDTAEQQEAKARVVLEIAGQDRIIFLQGLVTSDVRRVEQGIVYAALLTPQGKYLADFFLAPKSEEPVILLDVAAELAEGLERRLAMYRLRAAVEIRRSDLQVQRGFGPVPEGAYADPRASTLGWRLYTATPGPEPKADWAALRVAACIPETGIELIPSETYILEAGFDRIGGVDFRKGCYVGQEVTARMHHKTELRKGFRRVDLDGVGTPGAPITLGEKEIGTLYTCSGNQAIAYLRLDQAGPGMQAAGMGVRLAE